MNNKKYESIGGRPSVGIYNRLARNFFLDFCKAHYTNNHRSYCSPVRFRPTSVLTLRTNFGVIDRETP